MTCCFNNFISQLGGWYLYIIIGMFQAIRICLKDPFMIQKNISVEWVDPPLIPCKIQLFFKNIPLVSWNFRYRAPPAPDLIINIFVVFLHIFRTCRNNTLCKSTYGGILYIKRKTWSMSVLRYNHHNLSEMLYTQRYTWSMRVLRYNHHNFSETLNIQRFPWSMSVLIYNHNNFIKTLRIQSYTWSMRVLKYNTVHPEIHLVHESVEI